MSKNIFLQFILKILKKENIRNIFEINYDISVILQKYAYIYLHIMGWDRDRKEDWPETYDRSIQILSTYSEGG